MLFHQFRAGGCLSYLLACERSHVAALVDPEISLVERYLGEASSAGLRLKYVIDTHTHADHFSATHTVAQRLSLPAVMHRATEVVHVDLRVEDGEELLVEDLRLQVMHTPGHTSDSMCLVTSDRVLTGDTLLIQATGRTDLPTGDPGGDARGACSASCSAWTTRSWSSRPTTTRAAPRRPSARSGHEPAPAEPGSCGVRGADALAQPGHADPSHRGVAHEPQRGQVRGPDDRGGDAAPCPSVDGGGSAAHRRWRGDPEAARRARARRVRGPPSRRAPPRAGSLRRIGGRADPSTRLVVYCELGKILHARGRDAPGDGVPPRRGARRRHPRLEGGGFPIRPAKILPVRGDGALRAPMRGPPATARVTGASRDSRLDFLVTRAAPTLAAHRDEAEREQGTTRRSRTGCTTEVVSHRPRRADCSPAPGTRRPRAPRYRRGWGAARSDAVTRRATEHGSGNRLVGVGTSGRLRSPSSERWRSPAAT